MASLTINSTVRLNSGKDIPRLGFGVWDSPAHLTTASCLRALQVGYRHIDTAQVYGNEAHVGQALRESGIPREAIFVTTKILSPGEDEDATYRKCLDSIEQIGGESGYVDLMLIHNAAAGQRQVQRMWQAMERLNGEGRIRSIGVSNFGIGHLTAMKEYATVWPPAANQLELHPWCQQPAVLAYCREQGIALEAYCPLVRNQKSQDPVVVGLAEKHHTTATRALIRYSLEKNWIPLPKSDNTERIAQNAGVFAFQLDADDVRQLDAQDQGAEGALVMAVDNDATD